MSLSILVVGVIGVVVFALVKWGAVLKERRVTADDEKDPVLKYAGIGVGLGVAFGAAFDNVGLGVGLGIAIGAGIGAILTKRNDKVDLGQ